MSKHLDVGSVIIHGEYQLCGCVGGGIRVETILVNQSGSPIFLSNGKVLHWDNQAEPLNCQLCLEKVLRSTKDGARLGGILWLRIKIVDRACPKRTSSPIQTPAALN